MSKPIGFTETTKTKRRLYVRLPSTAATGFSDYVPVTLPQLKQTLDELPPEQRAEVIEPDPERAREELPEQFRMIHAIRAVRHHYAASLAEAKRAVESAFERHGGVR